ncbi:HNH endonuclease, partial [Sphingobium sp. 3R8]|uniref:HNH endonuclease n=1 Tax=Sphingobium sp. 3R8 TaxID=2874921 RepID=UPI001CCC5688
MIKTCLITGDPITPATDSRAHVIPSALGGRLKPRGLLCLLANSDLNDAVDLPLIRAFEPIMSQLDGSRDRGANPPISMTDAEGRVYKVAFGKPIMPARPEFAMEDKPDGAVDVHVSARSTAELRTLLGRVRKRFPAFDIEAAVLQAAVVSTRPGRLRGQLQIGPAVTFPAAFVAASIFAAHRSFEPHPQLRSYTCALKPLPDPVPLPPNTFLWHQPRWFEVDAQVSHVLALIGDPVTGRMLAFVEYFNIASVAVVLPFSGSTAVRETYAVDVLTGNEAKVTIDEKALAALPWSASHDLAAPAFRTNMVERI